MKNNFKVGDTVMGSDVISTASFFVSLVKKFDIISYYGRSKNWFCLIDGQSSKLEFLGYAQKDCCLCRMVLVEKKNKCFIHPG